MNTKENLAYALALDCYDKEHFERVILPVARQFSYRCRPSSMFHKCKHCGEFDGQFPCTKYDSDAYIVALLRECKLFDEISSLFGINIASEIAKQYTFLNFQKQVRLISENGSPTAKRVKLADLRHRITLEPENADQYNEAIAVLEVA